MVPCNAAEMASATFERMSSLAKRQVLKEAIDVFFVIVDMR